MIGNSPEKRILDALKESYPYGYTATELADRLGMARNTVAKYLYGLQIKNKITYRQVGIAKEVILVMDKCPNERR